MQGSQNIARSSITGVESGLPKPFLRLVEQVVTRGNLVLCDASTGFVFQTFGDGSGPEVWLSVSPQAAVRIAANPEMALGECYMDGSLSILRGDVYDFLELIFRNPIASEIARSGLGRLRLGIARRIQQLNDRGRAKANVSHHYDLSVELYRQFLDEDMQYSCAYFPSEAMSLDEAQQAKKTHIIAKLLIEPGHSVLDIGCGWGGLARQIAALDDVSVKGITLSPEQLAIAEGRSTNHRLKFSLEDYRDVEGAFDRIVSVGMFEHVGTPNYDEYFATIARLLKDDGVALVHSIGRKDGPDLNNPWIDKYIFPGGYIPSLSEVLPSIEKAGLWVTDVEVLRLHYAETLRHWRCRFKAIRHEAAELYDERFCRMWEFYLAGSETAFRHQGHMVFQIQLAKAVDTVPLTRDYITDYDRGMPCAAGVAR